ncbi:hypothetical protein P9A48_gp87 [Xanthomonas phage Mallos]|uniref:Uncharacterized protein n=1 Tax=Xanthomonas phage Mallos TaxID=2939131 RepID=A0A9E7J5H0_9CAUD|nr:hypothetical protein P9A48_gp87 [Xanthomonas phage Mallos]URA07195.1 hypothetical protein Mallos_BL60087 [Xanthomonas phage Mallos]
MASVLHQEKISIDFAARLFRSTTWLRWLRCSRLLS